MLAVHCIIYCVTFFPAAQGLSYGMWDLVPQPGIKPRAQHWELLATRPPGETPVFLLLLLTMCQASQYYLSESSQLFYVVGTIILSVLQEQET